MSAAPILTSVLRLGATMAVIRWIPPTHDEARGLLTSLEIAYELIRESDCFDHNFTDSDAVLVRENLFEQQSANITGLEPNYEYCVAIQVKTSGGDSGFSNIVKLPRKLPVVQL